MRNQLRYFIEIRILDQTMNIYLIQIFLFYTLFQQSTIQQQTFFQFQNTYIFIQKTKMLRKIHTSNSKKRFFHQQSHNNEPKSNNITRPPTSHPYTALRYIRSHETMYSRNNYVQKPYSDKEREENFKQIKMNEQTLEVKSKYADLPKSFLHSLTQIKILFKARQKHEEVLIRNCMNSLSKKIAQLYNQSQAHHKKCIYYQTQLDKLAEINEQLSKKIKKIEQNSNINRSKQKKESNNKDNQLMIENVKLAQLNAAYLLKLNSMQEIKKEKQIQIKKQTNEYENTQVLRYHNRISYLEMKLKNSEEKENQLSTLVQTLEDKILKLQHLIQKINEDKTQQAQKLSQWRERAMMQLEDSEMHITRQNFLLFSIKKLRQLNKGLTQKLIYQGNSEGHLFKNDIEPNPYFQYQIDFFKNIKNIYFDSKYKDLKFALTSKKQQNIEVSNFQLQEEYLEYRKFQEINLTLFTYYMPTFYSFIEQSITNQITNTRLKNNGSVSRIFIQILRAILNSKLNQFLMYPQENYTRFPQFVFTWFQRFYFNSQKCQVTALQPYMQKPFSQDLFYRDLMNIKLDQSWQIITFRQFLLEQLNLQELYFYLMCQNLLFRKAGITKSKQYQGDFCILVDYNAAKSVLDMVLSDFQSWNLSYLNSKMRQKIVYKKNVQYVQAGFFLRCLVQYYKIQRINRFKYINKLCDQFKSQEKGLRFSSFISVINRFTEVSIEQKIKLYRQCFCLGNGNITADIIFTVCSQKLIFLKYLKLKCFYKLPLLTTQKSIRNINFSLNKKNSQQPHQLQKKPIICLQPSDPYLYQIYTKMFHLLKNEGAYHKQVQKLGLIDMINNFNQLQKVFNDKLTSSDSSILRCRHFIHFLHESISKIKIINFTNFYELLQEQNKKKNNQSFWIEIQQSGLSKILAEQFTTTMKIYQKLTNQIEWKNKVVNFRLHHAARKIQRMVRKKFIAPFIQLYKIIYSQFKNGQQTKI